MGPITDDLTLAQAQNITVANAVQGEYYRDHYRPMEEMYLPELCAWFEERGPEPGVVVEVGPGHGSMIPWWGSRGWSVRVIDMMPRGHWISEDFLAAWQARYWERDVFAEVTSFVRGRADVVVMTQVIPHLRWRPDRALRNCAAMLREGGAVVTCVLDADRNPDAHPLWQDWRDMPEWGDGDENTQTVQCMFDEAAYRDLLESVFADVTIWRTAQGGVLYAEARDPR